ncbi:MAG: DNA polymerase IV [Nitratireductor sp.]|nr:DNA polymerase IV [Nitratireductor sp.]
MNDTAKPDAGPAEPSPAPGFCRDCLQPAEPVALLPGRGERCAHCGNPRLLRHPELYRLAIAHIDCDAFYASVEKRDHPELAALPVIVGGATRGVVSTCCYVARIRGVRSAMPMFKALQACPDAVVIKPNMEKYAKVGREIREMMRELTPLVEPLSIDEAFLDLSGTQKLHRASPAEVLARFARRVESELNLSVSVGLSYCKFLAKVASDFEKPRGFSVIGEAEAHDFLRRQPVSLFWGVGKATQAMLARDGITDIATIQDMAESELVKRYGSIGQRMARLSHGRDVRSVSPDSAAKSISSETTFDTDISDAKMLAAIARRLAERVSARLKDKHLAGQTVVLKLKTADFKTRTRNRTLADPTQLADRIHASAAAMLAKETDGTRFRLIGVGVSTLMSDETADPDDLVDRDAARRAKAEHAMDDIRRKFGNRAVELGLTFDRPGRGTKR